MVRDLVDFVRTHSHGATPVATYQRRDQLPRGFGVVSIAFGREPWFSGAFRSLTVSGIYNELSQRIAARNNRSGWPRSRNFQGKIHNEQESNAPVTHHTLGMHIRRLGGIVAPWVLVGLGLIIVLW